MWTLEQEAQRGRQALRLDVHQELRPGLRLPARDPKAGGCSGQTAVQTIRCPQGGCKANVRECTPNVFIRGDCNATHCNAMPCKRDTPEANFKLKGLTLKSQSVRLWRCQRRSVGVQG